MVRTQEVDTAHNRGGRSRRLNNYFKQVALGGDKTFICTYVPTADTNYELKECKEPSKESTPRGYFHDKTCERLGTEKKASGPCRTGREEQHVN